MDSALLACTFGESQLSLQPSLQSVRGVIRNKQNLIEEEIEVEREKKKVNRRGKGEGGREGEGTHILIHVAGLLHLCVCLPSRLLKREICPNKWHVLVISCFSFKNIFMCIDMFYFNIACGYE